MRHLFSLGICLALFIAQVQVAVGQIYTITDLGTLPGGLNSVGNGINQSGEVTGWADTSTGARRAFLFSNGTMRDLGTLAGGRGWSSADGVNQSGQVTGWSDTSDNSHAFLFRNGTMQDLGTLPGGIGSYGRGINDSGQVTGEAYLGSSHAFLFSHGTMRDLGTLPGGTFSSGVAINQSGQVTGVSGTSDAHHAFLFSNGTMQDLGTLPGGRFSDGRGINQSGQVTGSASTSDGNSHAFLFNNGTMQDLGTLPGGRWSAGNAINKSGQVTGSADNSAGGGAFIFSNGTMQDLKGLIPPDSGWTMLVAGTGINDAGQITGFGILNSSNHYNDSYHAFLLTPVLRDTTPPRIKLFARPTKLWPPNGKIVPVTVWGTITDVGSGVLARSVEYVVTDEYHLVQPKGHLTLDPSGNYLFTVLLRATREGHDKDGAWYMIRVSAKDNAGNRGAKSLAINVPHDRR